MRTCFFCMEKFQADGDRRTCGAAECETERRRIRACHEKNKRNARRQPKQQTKCDWCGIEFMPRSSTVKYHSVSCQRKASYAAKRNDQEWIARHRFNGRKSASKARTALVARVGIAEARRQWREAQAQRKRTPDQIERKNTKSKEYYGAIPPEIRRDKARERYARSPKHRGNIRRAAKAWIAKVRSDSKRAKQSPTRIIIASLLVT